MITEICLLKVKLFNSMSPLMLPYFTLWWADENSAAWCAELAKTVYSVSVLFCCMQKTLIV